MGGDVRVVVVSAILRWRAEADFDPGSTTIDLDFEGPTDSYFLQATHEALILSPDMPTGYA